MRISIITATYNSGATLRDTFESVLGQTYPDIEYLVIDGASKDDTVDLIRQYEPRFQGRMRWISEPDRGISFRVAADFENLLRLIFVHRIKTCYVPMERGNRVISEASMS